MFPGFGTLDVLCSLALLPKATINFQPRGLDLEKSWKKEKEERWDAHSEQQGKTKRWIKGKEKKEMKGRGSAIQHQRRSTGRKLGDSLVTSQAVGLDHIRSQLTAKQSPACAPGMAALNAWKCLLLLFCWFSTVGHVPDKKLPAQHQRPLPCPSCPEESTEGCSESALSCGKGHSSPEASPWFYLGSLNQEGWFSL